MKTRISLFVATGALALMASCAPGNEVDDPEDLGAAYELGDDGQVVHIPDSLAFASVDQNADSVIDQEELRAWLEAQSAFAEEAPASDSAATREGAGAIPQPIWSEDLDLTLTEREWQNSGRHLYTRTDDPGLFEEWDTDGDGRLDPLEALAGLDARGEGEPLETGPVSSRAQLSSVIFRLWDIDGNGTLEPDEYRGGIAVWWL